MLCQAGQSQNRRIFLENRKSRGANLQVCCRRDELTLPPRRRPVDSCKAVCPWDKPVSCGKGVISGKLEKKVLRTVKVTVSR